MAFRLESYGGLEGVHTSICLGGCINRIYLACDVRAFRAMIAIWYEEPELRDSQFHYHAH
jgi:hypothetical protein